LRAFAAAGSFSTFIERVSHGIEGLDIGSLLDEESEKP
jgi:hypothetical protein